MPSEDANAVLCTELNTLIPTMSPLNPPSALPLSSLHPSCPPPDSFSSQTLRLTHLQIRKQATWSKLDSLRRHGVISPGKSLSPHLRVDTVSPHQHVEDPWRVFLFLKMYTNLPTLKNLHIHSINQTEQSEESIADTIRDPAQS